MELNTSNKISPAANIASAQKENALNEDREYTDVRSITITPVTNYSAYRLANRASLKERRQVIGSSIKSCQILSSNKEEVEAYFPPIIGLSSNNPEFISRVKAYLSNIQLVVPEQGITLNISFVYNRKSDYEKQIKPKEDKINAEFDNINRADINAIENAVKKYIEDTNALESTKFKYGHPVNIQEYLMYRHCLLYREVAKDIALINSDSSIRFYIKNEQREKDKEMKRIAMKKIAMRNFLELNASDTKRTAVYIELAASNNSSVNDALLKSSAEQEAALMDLVNNDPAKFNKLYSDKNVLTKAFIETAIARGELIRAEFNQQISTPEGTFIGSNINEAVAYFDNPNNANIRTTLENKLKLI